MKAVAALYIDPRGPYPTLLGPEMCWDTSRDARTYAGPWPVVAHPPCGPWGRLRHLSKNQDPTCAPRAVEQVRCFGGVLEHPASSKLWEHSGLPLPGELPDSWGGLTIAIDQCDWSHVARKATWLYLVLPRGVRVSFPPRGTPTHWISGGRHPERKTYDGHRGYAPEGIKFCSAQQRRRTPIDFARWLIALARGG